jgi:hypothetical protein
VKIKCKYIIPHMYLKTGGKIAAIKRCSAITVRKCLPQRAKLIWITSIRISGVLL